MRIRARRSPEGSRYADVALPHAARGFSRAVVTLSRAIALLLTAVTITACGAGGIFQPYEYEEDIYLPLDGTATIYVNASIAALNALRGTSFDAAPSARFDREPFLKYFDTPITHVTRISQSRRSGRRFVHIRMDVDDVRRLAEAPPFAWAAYSFERVGNQFVYKQTLTAAAGKNVGDVGWNGREVVAIRLHLSSKIDYHKLPSDNRRGNIVVWEQPLADRLRGAPLEIEARMQTQSILYRTLWLFGATIVAVAIGFGITIWWILRRGKPAVEPVQPAGGA
jgi:hypothetical protein